MQVSAGIKAVLAIILIQLLSACAPPPPLRYSDQNTAKPLGDFEQATTRVSATIEDRRNSGIEVSKGQTYQITATGKWRTYSACNFTEADGIGLYTALCFKNPLYPPVIAGYSHATLIGRIGTDNEPFAYTVSPLRNPSNDARAIAAELQKLGFDVMLRLDANQQKMDSAVNDFGLNDDRLSPAGSGEESVVKQTGDEIREASNRIVEILVFE